MVVPPPGEGPGYWAGGPSAVFADGRYYLAYRLRRPVGSGRGYAVGIAASDDGVHFERIATLVKDAFGAESLERPMLVRRPDGGWRIYISCATPGTAHWWVDAIDGPDPASFDPAQRVTVLPGDDATAVKDPWIGWDADGWHMWLCCHPLTDPAATDRMSSRFARSDDGLTWTLSGAAISGTAGAWDARGARVSDLLQMDGMWVAYYDGRPSAAENTEEVMGIAAGPAPDALVPVGDGPLATSPYGTGSLRYLCALPLPGGSYRLYYEACVADGGHGLFTQLWEPDRPVPEGAHRFQLPPTGS
jgi:hypothetical protein